MMKNLANMTLLIGFLISSSIVYADTHYPDDLQVNISNLGSENCSLTKQVLLEGALYQSQLPITLPANGEKYYFTLSGESTTSLELTYQCGDYKKITLHMTQYHKSKHIHTSIDAHASNVIDVFEKHKSQVTLHNYKGGYPESGHKYPGTLSWQLSN